jgi:hypothetical protein
VIIGYCLCLSSSCPNAKPAIIGRGSVAIAFSDTKTIGQDAHIIDALKRDLVHHERRPAALIVFYRWLWRCVFGANRKSVGLLLQDIPYATGLFKSSVQASFKRLTRQRLISASRAPCPPMLRPIISTRLGRTKASLQEVRRRGDWRCDFMARSLANDFAEPSAGDSSMTVKLGLDTDYEKPSALPPQYFPGGFHA